MSLCTTVKSDFKIQNNKAKPFLLQKHVWTQIHKIGLRDVKKYVLNFGFSKRNMSNNKK